MRWWRDLRARRFRKAHSRRRGIAPFPEYTLPEASAGRKTDFKIGREVNESEQPTVLVIEDDPDGLRSVVDALELSGYKALSSGSGDEGTRLFEEHEVDAVLSDIRLPDLDGMEVLSRIRSMDPGVPVLLMTAYGTVSAAVAALKAR